MKETIAGKGANAGPVRVGTAKSSSRRVVLEQFVFLPTPTGESPKLLL
jgi:hypothetical protein